MIKITDPSKCCGCSACVNACPVHCIVMNCDREGFDYPMANPDLCIQCGRCDAVCPMQKEACSVELSQAYAVRFEEYVGSSSSGGVFPALAGKMLEDGGHVFGAVMESDMKVGHAEATCMDELESMRGSKYVQSDLYSVFEEIKDILQDGGKVIFTGTPCQVAGLNNYIGSPKEGLLTVDFACHGVPSPGLWKKYVKALEDRAGKRIVGVDFRDKSRSWRHYDLRLDYVDGTSEYIRRENDPYLSLFMQGLTLRPSCYDCRFKCGGSASDVTLSDLWNVAKVAPQLNDDKGVSGVFVNTEKGAGALETLSPAVMLKVDTTSARQENGGFAASKLMPDGREEFFIGAHLTTDLMRHMKGYVVKMPIYICIYRGFRALLSRIKRTMLR